jgi:hypothetical protein
MVNVIDALIRAKQYACPLHLFADDISLSDKCAWCGLNLNDYLTLSDYDG